MNAVTLGHGLVNNLAGIFKARNLFDPANVSLIVGKRLGNKSLDQIQHLGVFGLPRANGSDVRIIVLPCQLSGRLVPYQSRSDALDLVRCHLLTIATSTKNDSQRLDAS